MAVVYEPIVAEDIRLGYAPSGITVTMPAGGSARGSSVGIHTFLSTSVNVMDFGAVGDGLTDDTAAIRAACAVIQAAGGGTVHFPTRVYAIYRDTTDVDPLGDFTSVNGVHLSGPATLRVVRSFPTAEIVTLFRFRACLNIQIGDFIGSYTGATRSEIYLRGAQFAQFEQGCSNIRIGNLDLTDWEMGIRFQKGSSDPASYRCRDIRIANLTCTMVGYPLMCDDSGDLLEAQVNAESCGRSYFCYNPHGHRVRVVSKNQDASADCLLYASTGGVLENVDLEYINTETTNAGGGTRRGIYIAFRDGDVSAATMRNVRVRLAIAQSTGFLTEGLRLSKLVAAGAADVVDRGHVVDGLDITGYVDTSSGSLVLGDYATWGAGEFVYRPHLHDLHLLGGQPSLDLFTSLVGAGHITNTIYAGALNVSGNSTGRVVCTGVTCSELTRTTTDTGVMDLMSCTITNGSQLSRINKRFLHTAINGVVNSGY